MDASASSPEPRIGVSRREHNKVVKRQRLVAAARLLFRTHGLESTTAAAIAREAGVGSGTFYLYFASKEDLLIEIYTEEVAKIWNDAFTLTQTGVTIEDQLLEVFARATSGHDRDPGLSRVFFREMHFASPPVRAAGAAITATIHQRTAGLLVDAIARRELDASVDVEVLAETLFDVWYYAMLRRYGRPTTADDVLRAVERSLRMMLDFMRPRARNRRGR